MARRLSREALLAELEPVVAAAGCDLEDIDVTSAGRRSIVRVLVDRDGGVDLDVVAEVSTAVSAALDVSSSVGDVSYVLEVSSPGIGRPLTLARHWRRAVGRLVEMRQQDGRVVTGRVTAADSDGATLDAAGAEVRVSFSDVADARVQVEFSRPGEPELPDESDGTDGTDDSDDSDESEEEPDGH